MADTAAHVVDHVVPRTPLRQWVLSVPFEMRYRLGYDRTFCDDVLGTFMAAWMAEQRIRAKRVLGLASVTEAHPGALLFVQRFDSALRMNVHAHVLALDGVYLEEGGGVRFAALPEPTTADLERVVVRMLGKLHERFGDELGVGDDESSAMASCYAASLQNQDLFGARAGQPTLRLVGLQPTPNDATRLKVRIQGFDLDAQVAFDGRAHHHLRSQVIPKPYQPPPRPPLQLALFEGGSLLDPLDHRNGTSTGDAQPVRPGKAGPKGMRVR